MVRVAKLVRMVRVTGVLSLTRVLWVAGVQRKRGLTGHFAFKSREALENNPILQLESTYQVTLNFVDSI